jgi:hypothetical protein
LISFSNINHRQLWLASKAIEVTHQPQWDAAPPHQLPVCLREQQLTQQSMMAQRLENAVNTKSNPLND